MKNSFLNIPKSLKKFSGPSKTVTGAIKKMADKTSKVISEKQKLLKKKVSAAKK